MCVFNGMSTFFVILYINRLHFSSIIFYKRMKLFELFRINVVFEVLNCTIGIKSVVCMINWLK